MESNPMVVEVWRIKDQWARAAGVDIHRLCQNTHKGALGCRSGSGNGALCRFRDASNGRRRFIPAETATYA
jgi:hypothetical protein